MQTNFAALFDHVQNSSWTPDWLSSLRAEAFQRFMRSGLPDRSQEDWRYTNLKAIARRDYQLATASGGGIESSLADILIPDAYRLIFLNGVFQATESRLPPASELVILPLDQAFQERRPWIEPLLQGQAQQHRSSLEELNRAVFTSGAAIRIPAHTQIEQPIQLLYLYTDHGTSQFIAPRNVLVVEPGAEATIVESSFSQQDTHFTNMVAEVYVRPGAHITYVAEKVLGPESVHVSHTRFHVERDAQVKSFVLALGGRLIRSQLEFELLATGASAQLDGLYMGRLQGLIDNNSSVHHHAPHTQSSQVYKGLLFDQSRGVFDGKIKIAKQAQQTQAHQLNKTLLMSAEAEMDTKPQLRIDADDVRCSHGATVGRLDSNELFYLQSRGIPRDESERILSRAFLSDVIHRLHRPELEARLGKILAQHTGLESYSGSHT